MIFQETGVGSIGNDPVEMILLGKRARNLDVAKLFGLRVPVLCLSNEGEKAPR